MKKPLLVSLLFALCASAAWAQQEPDTDAFDGHWNASIQGSDGRRVTGLLTLVRFGGRWDATGANRLPTAKGCKGKRFPITVQNSVAAELEFTVWGSNVSPACPDLSITVKPLDEKTLEGKLTSGESIRLTRRK